jgi:hypothetical protein
VNADGIEQFLTKQFGQLLGSINSIDKDNHLIESQSIKKMCQLFELFILIDIDIELSQTMQDEFSFINENIRLIL